MSQGLRNNVLDRTISTDWRRDLVGCGPDEKRHWRTKVNYYDATLERLATGSEATLTWRTIVETVRPHGHRSTFYEVAGPNAKHPLIGAFLKNQGLEAIQVVLCYRRSNAVEQLIDEAKVWSYWPHRDGLLAGFRIAPELEVTAERVIATVAGWARQHPGVAAALCCAPPLCAVEDLLLVRRGQLSALNAVAILCDAIKRALPTSPAEPEPARPGPANTPESEVLLTDLATRIDAIGRESHRFTPAEAATLRRRAANLMR